MLKGNIALIVVMAVFSSMLWGCAGNLPESQRMDILEKNWGKSFESAKNNQILNPDAGKNEEPVVGINGEAAEYGVNKNKKSFKRDGAKTSTTVPLIRIGGKSKVSN